MVRHPMAGGGRSFRPARAGIRGERLLCAGIQRQRCAARASGIVIRASEPDSDRREQNFNVGGSVGRLDLAGWLNLNVADKNAKPVSDYLRTARLAVAELDYLGLAFRDVTLDLAAAEGGWRIAVGGPNVVGSITLPAAANSPEPWNLPIRASAVCRPERRWPRHRIGCRQYGSRRSRAE